MRLNETLGVFKEQESVISALLEKSGQELQARFAGNRVQDTLDGEIVLVLDHLQRWRHLHDKELSRLESLDLAISSEILNLPPESPAVCPGVWQLRERLNDRILQVEAARRQLTAAHEERVQALHDRLFNALSRRGQVLGPNPQSHGR